MAKPAHEIQVKFRVNRRQKKMLDAHAKRQRKSVADTLRQYIDTLTPGETKPAVATSDAPV